MGKIKVFLSDWQVLFREGIHFTLSGEEDFEVIGEATDNEEAMAFMQSNTPDVAILNVNHVKLGGIEVTQRIKCDLPSVGIILIMDSENEEQLFLAMRSGANACVTKDIDPDDMLNFIKEVAGNNYPVSSALLRPGIASRVLEEFESLVSVSENIAQLMAHLSPREVEILCHIAQGGSVEQVAEALNITEKEVYEQLEQVLFKLVSNEHTRVVAETAQVEVPLAIQRGALRAKLEGRPAEYVTREEFEAFKESLRETFKSLLGDLSIKRESPRQEESYKRGEHHIEKK